MQTLARMLLCLVISFTLVQLPVTKAHAGMITTSEVVKELSRTQGEKTVAKFLDRDDVKKELIALGVNPDDATKRIASLTDEDLNKLSMDIQKVQAGGDVVGVLLIVLLVVGIIYLAKRI